MSPLQSPTITFLIIISFHLKCSQGDCGTVRFKCNIPNDPACCEGPCCPFFHLYDNKQPGGDTLIISNRLPPIMDTISAPSQPKPQNGIKAELPPIQPSPLLPIPERSIINICANVPSCPCTETQCFEQRVPPYCACECPLEILVKEQANDPNICGIDNPGQIYNRDACACSCPPGSNKCDIHQTFNTNTCKCEPSNPIESVPTEPPPNTKPILPTEPKTASPTDRIPPSVPKTDLMPPPKPIIAPPTDPVPSEPMKVSPLKPEPVILEKCPKIGEKCTSAVNRNDRCCDGQKKGSTKCHYNGEDAEGNKIGICCVKNRKSGCKMDSDCCYGQCMNGICEGDKHRSFAAATAKKVEGKFDNFDVVKDEKDSKYIALSIPSVVIICIVILIIFPMLYYVYYKKVIVKKMEQSVRREIFHGLEINNHSDNEFADSEEDEEQYVD